MGQALLERAQNGVRIQGIFEALGSLTQYSKLASFYCANIPVRQDGNPHIFHHKVMVIDELILVTGSFNYTKNANTRNDENVLIITNREIASRYIEEFERRWSEANPPVVDSIECP
jgi:phosphatidylserine/phosphatidylglycerophosphate/cardiolipin synthase-like enzyme